MADPFATPPDLLAGYGPLTPDETSRAAVLLADASRRIRRRWPDIDVRIAAGQLDAEDVRMVACAMVHRAMPSSVSTPGVTEQADTAGPFEVTRKFGRYPAAPGRDQQAVRCPD
jgi:hypothetical protein